MVEDQDKPSLVKGAAWLAAAAALACVFALGIAPFVRAIPWSWEKHLGNAVDTIPDVCPGTPDQQMLLKKLVNRLYPVEPGDDKFSVDVHMVHNGQINAYAQLGGLIIINSGLLEKAQSPEELAGILAHEMTHVQRRHILEGFVVHLMTWGGLQMITGTSNVGWADYFLSMGFTRTQEAEADRGALRRLHQAHVANSGFASFFERMINMDAYPAFLSDHPSSESRLDMVKSYPRYETRPIMTNDEWQRFKRYCQ